MLLTYRGREVSVEVDFVLNEGCYVIAGEFTDTGEELSDVALESIELENQEYLYQQAYEHKAAAAYDYYKAARHEE